MSTFNTFQIMSFNALLLCNSSLYNLEILYLTAMTLVYNTL